MLALLVAPAAAALRASDRLVVQLRLAALFGAIAGVGGMELSYVADVAAGPSVALVACALAVVASLRPGRAATRAGRGRSRGWPAGTEELGALQVPAGFTGVPFTRTSKCRCAPNEWPVLPT